MNKEQEELVRLLEEALFDNQLQERLIAALDIAIADLQKVFGQKKVE